MTIFKKNLLTLGIAALSFSAVLVIFALVFKNSLYYETKIEALKNTAKTLMTAIGEERLIELFAANTGDIVTTPLPVSAGGAYRLTLIDPAGNVIWDSHVTDRL